MQCLEGLQALRTILCSTVYSEYGDSNIDSIQLGIDKGIIPFLANYLLTPNENIRMEAAW